VDEEAQFQSASYELYMFLKIELANWLLTPVSVALNASVSSPAIIATYFGIFRSFKLIEFDVLHRTDL
jgi:hypothetical protein